jgi:hypothetical protein
VGVLVIASLRVFSNARDVRALRMRRGRLAS